MSRVQLAPFAALSASYFAHIGFFNPYLPLWLKDLGLGLLAIGVLTSVQSATRIFAPYAWGWLSDHTGERVKLLRFSATVALVTSLALWSDTVSGSAVWLFVVLLVMFTHTSSMMSLSEAAMAELVSRGGGFDAGRYGRVRLWGSLGFLVTVVAAGAWFEAFGMAHFPAWTVATLAAVLVSVWWLPDLREQHPADTSAGSALAVLAQPGVRWFFASVFFHVMAHFAIYIFFSLYLDEAGYSKLTIGLLWAVSVLVEIGWFYTQGRWLPRAGVTAWLVIVALAAVLRMGITVGSVQVLVLLYAAQVLHGLTFAAHHTLCIAMVSRHFGGRLRGRGQALYSVIGYGFPGVFAGLGGGVLSARYGLASVYWAALGASVLGVLCAFMAWRHDRAAAPADRGAGGSAAPG